ncbi:MAG: transposase, partial [Desulfitobacteriaceae bacterium]|nr:transposase [Desulfitobacteriaceae bacterium]
MQDVKDRLAREVAKGCKTVGEVENTLRDLFKRTLQEILEAEMSDHLGYEKHSVEGNNSGNSRNGYSRKTIQTRMGETELAIPRDRNGAFEPHIIKKYEKNASELEQQIIAMYAKGMSTRDIEAHMRDIYGIDVSAELV